MENQHALRESVRNLNKIGEVAQCKMEDGLPRLVLLLQQNVIIFFSCIDGIYLMNEVSNFMSDRLVSVAKRLRRRVRMRKLFVLYFVGTTF